MADALEQTKDLFSVDDFNEDDISDKSKIISALENPFGEFRPKEEIIEKAKATGTGLLTGTLGIPSDAATLASAVSSGMAKYADSPTAMMLKDVLKKAEKDVGRPAFDKWFTDTTGLESNPENVDQLVGEVLSPTGAFLAPVKTLKDIFAPLKKGVTDFFDKMPPPDSGLATVNNAPVSSIEETSKLLDKTKTTKPIETSAPIIPESEFVNAKPTINPIFAGEGTETGKKQAAKFRELEAENKYTPEELFLQTRVYRGDDGQLRWEISTADAKLKSSWEKSLNFEDEFLGITVPEKADGFYDGRASMQLSQILDFPTAYKEYYDVKGVPKYFDDVQTKTREIMSETQLSPLRNLQVYWERGDRYDNTLGYYTPNRDRITLNVRQLKAAARQTAEDYGLPFEEAFKLQVESTLLHEVQHAVQVREGFRMGGDSDNFLPENFDALVSTNKYKKDRILLDIEDQFDIAIQDIAKKDASYNSLAVRNKILNEVEADFNTIYDVLVHKKTNSVDKYKNKSVEELNSIYKKADERLKNKFSTFKDYIYSQDIDRMKLGLLKNAEENVKLTNIDKEAINKYYNLYGEREARLVQKRLEDRFKLNKLGGAEVAKEVESDTKFLSAKGDTDTRGRKLGQMGGFPADTKITKTKLMADGTTFNNTIKKIESNNKKLNNPVFKKINEITKLQDGPLGSRTPMDKDGLPKNLLRDKDGKPLVLYYGDMGQVYDPKTQTYTPSDIPGKLKNKFEPSGRTYTIDRKIGNFVTPNPVFASGYASQQGGSVIPVYLIADKVTNIKASSFMDIDKAGGDAKRGEVFIGDVGYDSAPPVKLVKGREVKDLELRDESIKKYGTEQYTFNSGTQVFSAITGERLTELPTINQNIRNKLLNLTQKEEDIALKKMSPEERIKYKAEKTYIPEDEGSYFIEGEFKRDRKGDIELNERKRNLAKGGDMKKQMEMFEDGGLKQEGGTIDPVSGNDVPPGSTQEEVRDDIPAQLSEGEFVFPADVVRYIGLEKLMQLRQEAKQGLKQMEEMGQMGNSEEATMPDDLPFDETDLDIEDEEEYNNDTQEMNQGGMIRVGGMEMPRPIIAGQQMAEGGVVKAQSGTFVNPGTGVTTIPSQFAGQNLPSYNPNQTYQAFTRPSYTVPTIPGQTTGGYRPVFYGKPPADSKGITTPTFENLLGRNPGQYDEFREYKNDAGFTLRIPFRNGQPIYPIPEGFRFIDPEKEETETTTTQTTQTGTAQVSDSDGDTTGDRVGTTMVGKTGKGVTDKSLSTAQKTANVVNALQQNTPKSTLGKAIEAGAKGLLGAMMPGVGLLGGAALGTKSFYSPSGTSTQGLQGIGFTADTAQGIGYDAQGNVTVNGPMASVMGIDAVMDTLSQQAYGMSYAEATKAFGAAPTFSPGYKNGQVDPTTGATYAYGQATDDDGNVSYGSIDDFGIGMGAMAATGFMGTLADVDRVVNSPTATKEQKEAAKKYERIVTMKSKYGKDIDIDTISDKSFGDDSGPGPGDGGGATGDPDDDDSAATDVTSSSVAGPGNVSQSTDPDINSDDSDGVEAGTDNSSGAGVESGVSDFQIGGLAGKKKPKPKTKKMKRGGLASKK